MENKTPQWLKEVQNNSWSPEILISGLTITFIFVMNNSIHNFFAMLIQDFNAGIYANLSFLIFIVSLNVIKTVLILHLLLRGLWTGLIGLSYVYPEGVKNEKLPSVMKSVTFVKPAELVLSVEKVCSLLFSFIFIFIFALIVIVVFYAPAIIIESLVVKNSDTFILIYFFSLFIPMLIIAFLKKGKLKQGVQSNIFNNLFYTVSTNAGNVLIIFLLVISIIISIPLSYSQISNFSYDNLKPDKLEEAIFVKQNENYNDERNNELRVDKATIDSYYVLDKINLFISTYKEDEYDFKQLRENAELFLGVKGSKQDIISDKSAIYNVYIDSSLITNIKWLSTQHKYTSQKGLFTIIDNLDINSGLHKLRIDKIIWRNKTEEIEVISPWDDIVFYKK